MVRPASNPGRLETGQRSLHVLQGSVHGDFGAPSPQPPVQVPPPRDLPENTLFSA